MNILLAKLTGKTNEILKIMSTENEVWKVQDTDNSKDYTPDYKLEPDEWYKLDDFLERDFNNAIIKGAFDSTSYNQIEPNQYSKISYICSKQNNIFLFQRITASQFLSKKWLRISDAPVLEEEKPIIVLNSNPDAYYNKTTDILYFRDLSKIKPIFNGIENLFREATDTEVGEFLNKDFICLSENYSVESVKTMNRKRIVSALKTYSDFSDDERKEIINYTKDYCSKALVEDNKFVIKSEEDLKLVCFGIEQRYYTTQVGDEKRLANSVLKIEG